MKKGDILKKVLIAAALLCGSLLLLAVAGIYQLEIISPLLVVIAMFFVLYLLGLLFYRNRMLPALALLLLAVLFIIDPIAGFVCFALAVALYKPLTEKGGDG
jgi:hypothetical protein